MHDRRGDCFEKLVEWIEIRVQIMDEAKETGQLIDRYTQERCVISTYKEDHPP